MGGRLELGRGHRTATEAGVHRSGSPNTLRGVATDTANLKAFLKTLKGPLVLAGHSYGGFVITNAAATGNKNIKALVYVDAFIPDKGETVGS